MNAGAASSLTKSADASKAVGAFNLYAKQDGTIMRDDFVAGEFVEPGRVLFEISDETTVWVDARLSGADGAQIPPGTPVRVKTSSGAEFPGTVLQLRHQINEATRTLSARISVGNIDDNLHAGQFVTAMIQTGKTQPLLAVPQTAVTLMGGEPQVFVLEGDQFVPTPVLLGAEYGNWVVIKGGLSLGDEVAISQVFLLKSLILKSSIGDEH
jgi:cobalt-zinc-cadmium efflux system membrane fusion protein